jgi:hypothetical protein
MITCRRRSKGKHTWARPYPKLVEWQQDRFKYGLLIGTDRKAEHSRSVDLCLGHMRWRRCQV